MNIIALAFWIAVFLLVLPFTLFLVLGIGGLAMISVLDNLGAINNACWVIIAVSSVVAGLVYLRSAFERSAANKPCPYSNRKERGADLC